MSLEITIALLILMVTLMKLEIRYMKKLVEHRQLFIRAINDTTDRINEFNKNQSIKITEIKEGIQRLAK